MTDSSMMGYRQPISPSIHREFTIVEMTGFSPAPISKCDKIGENLKGNSAAVIEITLEAIEGLGCGRHSTHSRILGI